MDTDPDAAAVTPKAVRVMRDVSVRTKALDAVASAGSHGHGKHTPPKTGGFIEKMRKLVGPDSKVSHLLKRFHEYATAKTGHWALEVNDRPPGDPWTGIVAELFQEKMKSDVKFTLGFEPEGFRVVDGVYTEIMRRIHGETDRTNDEVKEASYKTMDRQPRYGLLDSNCQRFVTLLAWDILKTPSFELDLIAGEEIVDEATSHVENKEEKPERVIKDQGPAHGGEEGS